MAGEGEFLEAMAHPIRRKIIEYVYDRVEVSYTELLEELKLGAGTLNFHLKKLSPFLERTDKGTYILSDKGKLAVQILALIRGAVRPPERIGPSLGKDVIVLRVAAFLIDALIFFIFSGVFLDPQLWGSIIEAIRHIYLIVEFHPWIFHLEHIPALAQLISKLVGTYAHIFFAVYIFVTVLEAYKGQTPGKYLMGIRVVKRNGGKISLIESAIRNGGKVFLLPFDLLVGIIAYRKKGYIRFFDYYTEATIEKITKLKM